MAPKKSSQAGCGDNESEVASQCGRTDRKHRPEIPDDVAIATFDLPNTYRIKYCRLCDNSSISLAELLEQTAGWGELIPWGNGTRNAPTGVYCRSVCGYCYCFKF